MIYQHPLAYLIGLEGVALLRAWSGDFDEAFVRERLDEVRHLLEDETLTGHPGVHVEQGATGDAYRQWATTYDDPGNDLLELDLPFIDAVLDTLPSGSAVDTACGTGRLTRRLARRGHLVVGVDGSVDMVRQARQNVSGISFVVGDLHDLPLPDASVDLVTNALALTHVADLDRVLAEFARVLRPGGTALISDVHPDLVTLGSSVKAPGTGRDSHSWPRATGVLSPTTCELRCQPASTFVASTSAPGRAWKSRSPLRLRNQCARSARGRTGPGRCSTGRPRPAALRGTSPTCCSGTSSSTTRASCVASYEVVAGATTSYDVPVTAGAAPVRPAAGVVLRAGSRP